VGQTCVKWENSQGWRPMVFGHQLLIEFLPTNQNAIFQSRGSDRTSHSMIFGVQKKAANQF